MLPGKRYTPQEVLGVLRWRIWLLVVPFAVISAATAIYARRLPDRYRSEAVILVVPQQVPESYVKSTVTTRIEDRLDSIQQQILSRTRLERIIEEMNLYPAERRTGIMEDVVEQMRKDMAVQVVRGDAFKVSYEGTDPRLIAKVTDRLASLFIEESLQDRTALTEGTTEFLEGQLEDARRRLIEQEKKLEAYRVKYSGQLPTQVDSNLQALQGTSLQVQSIVESINRDHSQRLLVERQLTDAQESASALADTPAASSGATTQTPAQQLALAKNTLAAMQQRGLTPEHPDVQAMNRLIADLQAKVDADALTHPVSASPVLSPAESARHKRVADLQAELAQLDDQIKAKETEEARLREVAKTYQQKIDAVPERESEMTELMRDYGTLQTIYTNLLAKKEESNIAANLERRQIGEQFKLLDPAHVPERPISPNRRQIDGMGMVVALAVGLGLVLLAEVRDATFNNEEDLERLFSIPVLAVIPVMESDVEHRQEKRHRLVLTAGLGGTVAVCFAILVYAFVR